MDKIESMDFGQTVVFILGSCEVSVSQGGIEERIVVGELLALLPQQRV